MLPPKYAIIMHFWRQNARWFLIEEFYYLRDRNPAELWTRSKILEVKRNCRVSTAHVTLVLCIYYWSKNYHRMEPFLIDAHHDFLCSVGKMNYQNNIIMNFLTHNHYPFFTCYFLLELYRKFFYGDDMEK